MSCKTLKTKETEVFSFRELFVVLYRHFWLVWIIGHVLSGWDGTDALEAPSNLCGCHAFMTRFSTTLTFFSL